MKRQARADRAFTLLELLVVIGIIAVLASMGVGALRGFNATNAVAAGNRQLLDDLNMARNYALGHRTTVYMVFLPVLRDVGAIGAGLTADQKRVLTNRVTGQLTSYNFITKHAPGDQPGQGTIRFLSEWKSLPNGVYISTNEFVVMPPQLWAAAALTPQGTNLPMTYYPFRFPTINSPVTNLLPCVAFNFRGELLGPTNGVPRRVDEYIRLTRGSIIYPELGGPTSVFASPETIETPRGNSTNNPFIRIDWITGRARLQEPSI